MIRVWTRTSTEEQDARAARRELEASLRRDLAPGEHVFVMARPRVRDWSDFHGTMKQGNDEFRPCMVSGSDEGQRVFVVGSQYGYDHADFEFGPDIELVPQPAPGPR